MKVLPQGINVNAGRIDEAYVGVEDENVREELVALALLLNKNQVALAALTIVTGIDFDNVCAGANYLWQHIENGRSLTALLMTDIAQDTSLEEAKKWAESKISESKGE